MADEEHSLKTYISDMLSLEQHVRVPFEAQLNDGDLAAYPNAQTLLRRLSDVSNQHIRTLETLLESYGGHQAQPVKSAVTNVAGFFASAIDKMRKTKVAKGLRDDYTALSLCTVSYSMLLTTAQAYGAPQVAEVSQQHMRDYAGIIMDIGLAIPEIVVYDLQQTGLAADANVVPDSRRVIEDVWRSGAAAQRSQSSTFGEVPMGTATARTSQ
jgi:hypothetical protein